ncbi:MAG: DUF4260 family protein [Chloroflexota bacterium]|nr:DUF4260 family protein [Chloroflexota bacterium]
MRQATAIHRTEYLALALILVGVAIGGKDQLGWAFWLFLLAPDLFGLLPASVMGKAPARGYLSPRGVWLYNVWHTFTPPLVIGVVLALLIPFGSPWPLLGWLIHVCVDRLLGFGLRGDDGGQALF